MLQISSSIFSVSVDLNGLRENQATLPKLFGEWCWWK
jgi:hypothetical protein